jgi:hypothetical protein
VAKSTYDTSAAREMRGKKGIIEVDKDCREMVLNYLRSESCLLEPHTPRLFQAGFPSPSWLIVMFGTTP